jgi:hypothetical protein
MTTTRPPLHVLTLHGPKWCDHWGLADGRLGSTCLCDDGDCRRPAAAWVVVHGIHHHYCEEHAGARRERAAIVAWLTDDYGDGFPPAEWLAELAEKIARGEHR